MPRIAVTHWMNYYSTFHLDAQHTALYGREQTAQQVENCGLGDCAEVPKCLLEKGAPLEFHKVPLWVTEPFTVLRMR